MLSSSKKAFVLVPGSFCREMFYRKVIPYPEKDGYESHPTPLLSVGKRDESPATMQEDATFIHNVITKLSKDDKEVILVMNSYGGLSGTEASKGVGKVDVRSKDRKAALLPLSILFPSPLQLEQTCKTSWEKTSLVLSETEYIYFHFLRNQPVYYLQDEYTFINLDEDYKSIFSDLSEADGKAYIKEFSCHSTVSFTGRLTYPAYKFIPTTYVIAEGDKVIPL
jgi:hypothetical protein